VTDPENPPRPLGSCSGSRGAEGDRALEVVARRVANLETLRGISHRELRQGRSMQGDYFDLIKTGNGKYRWELWGSHHPTGPIARSGRDYTSVQNARNSMKSARNAMMGAVDDKGEVRVNLREE
jgi:uncharacterized protein YegP (UPF0339 family)